LTPDDVKSVGGVDRSFSKELIAASGFQTICYSGEGCSLSHVMKTVFAENKETKALDSAGFVNEATRIMMSHCRTYATNPVRYQLVTGTSPSIQLQPLPRNPTYQWQIPGFYRWALGVGYRVEGPVSLLLYNVLHRSLCQWAQRKKFRIASSLSTEIDKALKGRVSQDIDTALLDTLVTRATTRTFNLFHWARNNGYIVEASVKDRIRYFIVRNLREWSGRADWVAPLSPLALDRIP
jgi:hypothetical protein